MKKISLKTIFSAESRLKRMLFAVVSGVLSGLCITFPSTAGAIFQFFVYIPAALLLYSLASDAKKHIFRRCWLWGFLFFMSEYLVVYHWFFSFYPLDFTGMSRASAAVVVGVAWVGLSLLAAFPGGLVFVAFRAIANGSAAKKVKWLLPFSGGALFAIFEWVETIGWTGVPWGRAALGQLAVKNSPMAQSASLLGSYFVTFLIVSVSFLFAESLKSEKTPGFSSFLPSAVAVVLVSANLLFGFVYTSLPLSENKKMTVAAVQGNISSREKWDNSTYGTTTDVYKEYTVEAANNGAKLVVFPESSFPYPLLPDSYTLREFSGIAREYGISIVIGSIEVSDEGQKNALFCIYPDGNVSDKVYVKRHLVPFGEYMPMREVLSRLIPPLAEIAMLEEDLAQGKGSEIMRLKNGISVGCLICFDSIYEELTISSVRDGAEIILLGTNDSWFKDSAAVYMHNSQARLRAIECGVPVVRAANTGISSVIDNRGNVISELPPLVGGIVYGEVAAGSPTLYAKIGNLFVCLCIAFCFAIKGFDISACLIKKKK